MVKAGHFDRADDDFRPIAVDPECASVRKCPDTVEWRHRNQMHMMIMFHEASDMINIEV